MVFVNAWMLLALIPLTFFYLRYRPSNPSRSTRLLYAAALLMLLALARPAVVDTAQTRQHETHDYIVAVDASFSMQADDLSPTRYAVAKAAIARLLRRHPHDRFTLFAFTANALLISPPTTDTAISLQALDALNPQYILSKSTDLRSLFKAVAKLPMREKTLIVFSDGGDESDTAGLATLLKRSRIRPYFAATGTRHGAALKKDGHLLKDRHDALVVSRINPMLEPLARESGGRYYEIRTPEDIDALSDDLDADAVKIHTFRVQSLHELFFVPLLLAMLLFFAAVTRLHRLYPFVLVAMLTPHAARAGVFDGWQLHRAQTALHEKRYEEAARAYEKMAPSPKSFYNAATAWYMAGNYAKAIEYYRQIKTADPVLKEAVFYNMGNAAARMHRFDEARRWYLHALSLTDDPDALHNLRVVEARARQHQPPAVTARKHGNDRASAGVQRKNGNKRKKKAASDDKGGSKRPAETAAHGGGGSEHRTKRIPVADKNAPETPQHRLGYRAYELINKGYSHESKPW